jgi:hypothetical protein
MTPSGKIPRRLFLQTLFSLHVSAFIGLAHSHARQKADGSVDPLPAKLVSFFSHKESAKQVGLEYLKSTPMEADVHLLTRLICSFNEEYREKLLQSDSKRLRDLLRQRLCIDFEKDDVVTVNGWILAATEARLCALTALLS